HRVRYAGRAVHREPAGPHAPAIPCASGRAPPPQCYLAASRRSAPPAGALRASRRHHRRHTAADDSSRDGLPVPLVRTAAGRIPDAARIAAGALVRLADYRAAATVAVPLGAATAEAATEARCPSRRFAV